MIKLNNDRLILNGHRIFTNEQLFAYLTKKFRLTIQKEEDIIQLLSEYENLKISIWHADTFLTEESLESRNKVIKTLEKCGEVKQTGFH